MDYQSLRRGWNDYPKDYDASYDESIGSGIWDDPLTHINEKIQFLNDWLCRVDRETAIPSIELRSGQFNDFLREIQALNLLSLTPRNSEQVKRIYDLLVEVDGLGPTGISKYLHMHKRDLFIMWDNQIFRDYFHIKTVSKITATSEKYLKFLLRMRDEILEAAHTLSPSANILEAQAIMELRNHFNNETPPRIIDKYNFATRGHPKQRIN